MYLSAAREYWILNSAAVDSTYPHDHVCRTANLDGLKRSLASTLHFGLPKESGIVLL
jgi:hypothetical protein